MVGNAIGKDLVEPAERLLVTHLPCCPRGDGAAATALDDASLLDDERLAGQHALDLGVEPRKLEPMQRLRHGHDVDG